MTDERFIEMYEYFNDMDAKFASVEEKDGVKCIPCTYTTEEIMEYQLEITRRKLFPKLIEYRKENNWQDFCDLVLIYPRLMPYAFLYYNEMPEKFRRDFVVNCYDSHGDIFPTCRAAVRKLPKNGKNELPEEYRDKEFITVYRAGEEPIEKSQYRISWTLDRKIAEFFLNDYIGKHADNLYSAKIRPCDVIAFNDNRNEKEVMQYRKVYDVQLLERKGA